MPRRGDEGGLSALAGAEAPLLSGPKERELLAALAECKCKLADALASIPRADVPDEGNDPRTLAQYVTSFYAGDRPAEARLGAIFQRYTELRGQLAMANTRLVAHIAKRFRERGISYADLLQEGYCGLLEAIDRFDLSHGTKLATYATWWIRQSMQRAVASGAYPVRLSPRHLRQLAQNQADLEPSRADLMSAPHLGKRPSGAASGELIQRIHTATRPTVSLDLNFSQKTQFSLMQTLSDPARDAVEDVDWDEAIGTLMETLRPREQLVLSLRFGLGDKPCLSLSQVGKVLGVSKERVRQIQDRALEKLRAVADERKLADLLSPEG